MSLQAETLYPAGELAAQHTRETDVEREAEQQHRAGAWALLGRLLRAAPDADTLDQLVSLAREGAHCRDELSLSMTMLGLAAGSTSEASADDEFHALFIGLGRGELVPFGSWYLTGYLMESPLSQLRDDLRALGFERQDDVCEPEDHMAALAEVMSMLIASGEPVATQSVFHATHIGPWATTFFDDLSLAHSAVFYRAVGRFGRAFEDFEQQYLNMKV